MKLIKNIKQRLLKDHSVEKWWKLREKVKTKNSFMKFIYSLKYNKLCKEYNCFIAFSAKIKNLPTFPHDLYGIFISNGAKIGSNCVIFQQVTIGSNTLADSKRKGAPTIGDNVYIGAGAKIVGKVTVGNNVRIGANCVVTQDIPDNSTVVLEKPRVITKDYVQDNTFHIYRADS